MLQLVIKRKYKKCNRKDKSAISIEGTRAFRYIKPIGATGLSMKRISDDKQFSQELISSHYEKIFLHKTPTMDSMFQPYVMIIGIKV